MDAIKKLRDRNYRPEYRGEPTLEMLADKIEAEISERYMERPVDADGVPIRVGDELTCIDFKIQAAALSPERVYYWDDEKQAHWVTSDLCRHYRKPTIEDVLREFAAEYQRDDESIGDTSYAVERCIEKLREVMADE